MDVNITSLVTLKDAPVYRRWTGSLKGGIEGSETWEGVGLYEQRYLPSS
jgi:hypothetical protein